MPKQIGYAIFVLVTVLAVIGAVREFANHEANTSEDAGALMFPDFKANLNDSATIKVVGEDGAFTLKRESSGQWVFVENEGSHIGWVAHMQFPCVRGQSSEILRNPKKL